MPIQTSTDTELSAVNSILGSIGQSPVNAITGDALQNPEIAYVKNLLLEVNKDVQTTGWHFNTQLREKRQPDNNGNYLIPQDAIQFDLSDGQVDRNRDVVRKNGKLWDKIHQTDVFTQDFYFDITYLFAFNDVPPAIQRYIIARASVRAAVQLVSNPELVKLLKMEEEQAKANALNYETEQGDNSFFGFPDETSYRAYKPYKALLR